MNLLLDTHVAIWAVAAPQKIPKAVADMVADEENRVFISVAGIWEIAVKYALGKASAPPFSGKRALTMFGAVGFETLDIRAQHVVVMDELPRLHGDPFDRIMLAQALTEPMRLITHDKQLGAHSDTIISW